VIAVPTAYVTAPRDAAADIAEQLVERRLAACVNVVDCRSVYRWDGDTVSDDESVLFVKTTDGAYDAFVRAIEELHPHDVPCIERFDEDDVAARFAEWRADSVVD